MKRARKPTRAALRQELNALVLELASRVFELIERHGLLDEPRPGPAPVEPAPSRRVRRSAKALGQLGERIVAILRARRTPVGIGAMGRELGLTSRQLSHPIALLVEEGAVVRTGTRRGARYQLSRSGRAVKRR